jgi:hypothetical protein
MTLPARPPKRGTRIVFVGSTKDALLTVDVEENAPAVELSGRITQLTTDGGLPIWVNLANVLYAESVKLADRLPVTPWPGLWRWGLGRTERARSHDLSTAPEPGGEWSASGLTDGFRDRP